jgi:tetratricopeptide (TPR) repeat protein
MTPDRRLPLAWRRAAGPFLALAAIGIFSAWAVARGGQQAAPADFATASREALARGRLDEAEALARSQPPDDPRAAAVRGRILAIRGRYEEAATLLAPVAAAQPASQAALEYGLIARAIGRRSESDRAFMGVIEGLRRGRRPETLYRAAVAAQALGQFQDANNFFRSAVAGAPDDPEVQTGWGDLFLEKYNKPEAVKSYQAALRLDPEWSPALFGMARAIADENPPAAKAAAEKALEVNPGLTEAHLFLAELALDEGRRDEARTLIAKAQGINPNSLEAQALLAAIAHLEGKTAEFEAAAAKVRAINPGYGELYRVAGDHAARNYRFDEAVTLVRRALEIEPDNIRAHADLGMHLLRTGDEPAAKQALDRSFKSDPFDVVTFNLLSMFDTLEKFETIQDGDIIVRMHPEEAPVLKEYALPLAKEALSTLGKRYNFTPRGPILIEIFPKHDDFAVRNVGLPGMIGALGACFGRVVTMDSPRARPPGTFHWGATLWHELAHVITLQMSNQRVPRWLTEGISVFEEKRARPEWGREMEIPFAQAMNQDQVLKLTDLNSGFTKPETIALAYFQASLLVEHIIDTFGEPAVHRLLRAYGEGLETDAALQQALNVGMAGLQTGFDEQLEKSFGGLRRALQGPKAELPSGGDKLGLLRIAATANPGSYPVLLALGGAQAAAGDTEAAIQTLERAVALVPMATGPDSARGQLIELSLQKGDRARAMRELELLLQHDHSNVEAARQLADLAEGAGDERLLWLAHERIVALDPFDAGRHGSLGRLAMKRKDLDLAQREFRAALAAGPVDLAGAHCDLAESYLAAGRVADAKKHALQALELAPSFERAQELLLQVVGTP